MKGGLVVSVVGAFLVILALAWLMGALDFPDYAPEIYAYGTVIGTGNVVATWNPPTAKPAAAATAEVPA